jgi:hypothetical protein
MKITKFNLPHYLNQNSSITDILIALGMCSSLEVKLVDTVLVPADVCQILVNKGVISTGDRDYALAVSEFFRTEFTPAAQFRHMQEVLRAGWGKLFGGELLDEAPAEISHYPYAPKQTQIAGE